MTEETGAAAPTTEQAAPGAPAVSEQATPETSVSQEADAAEEATETEGEEQDESQDEGEGAEPKPKRRTTNERNRRKISTLAGKLADTDAERQREATEKEQWRRKYEEAVAGQQDPEPNPGDYPNGEYDAKYLRDVAAHAGRAEAKKETAAFRKDLPKAPQAADLERKSLEQKTREKFPDFDKKVQSFIDEGGAFSEAMMDAVAKSKAAPFVMNYLLLNPDKADSLLEMSPQQVFLELGEISANLSRSPTKQKTLAPPPVRQLNGGAAPPVDVKTLAKNDDATDLIAHWRNKARA